MKILFKLVNIWYSHKGLAIGVMGVLILSMLAISVLWVLEPNGPYEPVIVLLGICLSILTVLPEQIVKIKEKEIPFKDLNDLVDSDQKQSVVRPRMSGSISGDNLLKVLLNLGVSKVRQAGSHVTMVKDGISVSFPASTRGLTPPMLHRVSNQVALMGIMSRDDFIALVRNPSLYRKLAHESETHSENN